MRHGQQDAADGSQYRQTGPDVNFRIGGALRGPQKGRTTTITTIPIISTAGTSLTMR